MTMVTVEMNSEETQAKKATRIVLASSHQTRLAELAMGLWTLMDCELHRMSRCDEILAMLENGTVSLVVIDEKLEDVSGLELAKEIAHHHPFVNSVMVDGTDPDAFHEKTEGLGILHQLPDPPEMVDAKSIVSRLRLVSAGGQADGGVAGRLI